MSCLAYNKVGKLSGDQPYFALLLSIQHCCGQNHLLKLLVESLPFTIYVHDLMHDKVLFVNLTDSEACSISVG